MKAKIIAPNLINPERLESPVERKARLRAEYNLATHTGLEKSAAPADVADEIEEPMREEIAPTAEAPDELDEIREAMQLGPNDSPAFWAAARQVREKLRADKERAAIKAAKQAAVTPAVLVTEPSGGPSRGDRDALARELSELQSSPQGFTSRGRRRRAEIRKELQRAG